MNNLYDALGGLLVERLSDRDQELVDRVHDLMGEASVVGEQLAEEFAEGIGETRGIPIPDFRLAADLRCELEAAREEWIDAAVWYARRHWRTCMVPPYEEEDLSSDDEAETATCATCRFFEPERFYGEAGEVVNEADGGCRRHAPRQVRADEGSFWPRVSSSDWCGDFRARAPAKPAGE